MAGNDSAAGGPLAGVRVVEMGQLIAGPFCGQLLGDMGAEVIKIETPGSGDPMREWGRGDRPLWWEVIARNKKSVTVNLRTAAGQSLARSLIAKADIPPGRTQTRARISEVAASPSRLDGRYGCNAAASGSRGAHSGEHLDERCSQQGHRDCPESHSDRHIAKVAFAGADFIPKRFVSRQGPLRNQRPFRFRWATIAAPAARCRAQSDLAGRSLLGLTP